MSDLLRLNCIWALAAREWPVRTIAAPEWNACMNVGVAGEHSSPLQRFLLTMVLLKSVPPVEISML